jgi:hypothetical protein
MTRAISVKVDPPCVENCHTNDFNFGTQRLIGKEAPLTLSRELISAAVHACETI